MSPAQSHHNLPDDDPIKPTAAGARPSPGLAVDGRSAQVGAPLEVLEIRPAGDGEWGVVSVRRTDNNHQREPCARCPWRTDAPLGAFPAQVYRDSARTTYDLARHVFGCHASTPTRPLTCAGFLLRGAGDNLTIRVAFLEGQIDPDSVRSTVELYPDYRAMAIANGVASDDPALRACPGERPLLE